MIGACTLDRKKKHFDLVLCHYYIPLVKFICQIPRRLSTVDSIESCTPCSSYANGLSLTLIMFAASGARRLSLRFARAAQFRPVAHHRYQYAEVWSARCPPYCARRKLPIYPSHINTGKINEIKKGNSLIKKVCFITTSNT